MMLNTEKPHGMLVDMHCIMEVGTSYNIRTICHGKYFTYYDMYCSSKEVRDPLHVVYFLSNKEGGCYLWQNHIVEDRRHCIVGFELSKGENK